MRIDQLRSGDMFRYKNRREEENIYKVLETSGNKMYVKLLTTGSTYVKRRADETEVELAFEKRCGCCHRCCEVDHRYVDVGSLSTGDLFEFDGVVYKKAEAYRDTCLVYGITAGDIVRPLVSAAKVKRLQ